MTLPAPHPNPTQDEAPRNAGFPETWLIALLLLLALLPYANTLQNGFVYDDNHEVLTNPYIRSFSRVGDIFRTRILAHLGARGATNYYRPIGILGFLICYQLFGVLPYGFHLANVLLHALTVCLIFGLTKRLFHDQWMAFAAAAVFALHPIHTESVAWVSGVTDLDLAVFYLAAFWFFVASARPQGARSEWAQLGMVASFAVALLSKEQAVTLPLTAMVYEHFYRGDRAATTWRQKASRYAALWLLLAVYVLFRIRFFGAFAPVQLTRDVSWYQAILSAAPLAGLYVWKMIWPVHLVAYYPFHKSVTPLDARVLAGVAVLALCALAFGFLWRRSHRVSFGLAWFFINIAPVLNSRWLGPNVFTERYLYLPSVGLCWVAAWGILRVWNGKKDPSPDLVPRPPSPHGRGEEPARAAARPQPDLPSPHGRGEEPARAAARPQPDLPSPNGSGEEPPRAAERPQPDLPSPNGSGEEPPRAAARPQPDLPSPNGSGKEPPGAAERPQPDLPSPHGRGKEPSRAAARPQPDLPSPNGSGEEPPRAAARPQPDLPSPNGSGKEPPGAAERPQPDLPSPHGRGKEPSRAAARPQPDFPSPRGEGGGHAPPGEGVRRVRRWVFGALLAAVATLAFVRIVTRNRDWSDDATYYRVTLAAEPEAAGLRLNLGAVYWNHMQPDAAEREWKQALAASPGSAALLNNLGLVCAGRKQNAQAIAYFQRSMRLRPNYTDAHLNLGRVYAATGNAADAELQLRAAVALAPLSVETRNELGSFYLAAGRLEEAQSQFQASAASIPNAAAFDSLGDIAVRQGHRAAAERAYRQAIALEEFDSRGHFGLAAMLVVEGRAAEAIDQYRAGLRVDPLNAQAKAALERLTSNSSYAHAPKP